MAAYGQPDDIFFSIGKDLDVIRQRRFRHPTAALFHVVFKVAAVAVYLFGGFFFSETFIGIYVALILLVSMDFWTVKNVTGRLMVGLRWWNFIDDEGNSHWVFENRHLKQSADPSQDSPSTGDGSLFWTALVLTPAVWSFLLLVAVFRLNIQYFMIVALALVLSLSNLYGYIRCRFGSADLKAAATQYVGKRLLFNFLSSNVGQNKTPTHGNPPVYPSA